MTTKFHTLLALGASVLWATSALAGQAKPAAKPATPAAQAPPAAPAKFVPPIRGEAQVSMTKPVTKRTNEEIVTTLRGKTPPARGSIAALKIGDFGYERGGNPVSGDEFRYRKPLL